MEKDSDHFKSVKTTLNSLRVDNSRLSSSVLEIIENKIVPYWQVVKANVANFSNFFLIYVLEAEPTEEIPLLLTDAFYDRCILLTTVLKNDNGNKVDDLMSRVYSIYRSFLNKDYLNHLDKHISNNRTGMAKINNELRNELLEAAEKHIKQNYSLNIVKRIKLNFYLENLNRIEENKNLPKSRRVPLLLKSELLDRIRNHYDEFKTLMGCVKGDQKRGYKHNIKDQRSLLNDFHACQKQFEEYIDSFGVVSKLKVPNEKFKLHYFNL